MAALLKDNPECVIELRVGLVHGLRSLLERGRSDLVIGPRSLVETAAELDFDLIVDDRIGILCCTDHPLTRTNMPSPNELEQQRWVAHSRGSLLRQQTETALIALGLDQIRIGCETDSIRSVLELVEKTEMISTMPRETTKPYLEDKLVFLDLDQPHFHRPIGAIRRRDQPRSMLEARVILLLKQRRRSGFRQSTNKR